MAAKRTVYMDHNATTPLHPRVQETMRQTMSVFGNPSSLHAYGREAKTLLDASRRDIASFIGAEPDEIIFVGSGSEANNTVLSMFACPSAHCVSHQKMRRTIVTTAIEHPCILETSKCLTDRGLNVVYLDVDEYGLVKREQLKEILTDNVGIVSVMMANNEIGTVQDIKEIAALVHTRGALMHTDAVQAVGKIPIDVRELGVDFLSISAHKIYGPKGVGALYAKKGVPFCPLIRGGHQEKGRRAGTENTLGIIGFGEAIRMRRLEMEKEETRLLKMKAALKAGIKKCISGIRFNGHPAKSLASTLNVSFEGVEGEALLLYLDMEGIAVSTGSACASGSLDPSHVLLATGLGPEHAHGSIRISLGRESTDEDIAYFLEILPSVVERVRSMSTAYVKGKDGKTR